MNPAFVVRFRPAGPWRIGPDSGDRERVGRVLHSDALFSAVTHAMARLGRLDEWLAAMVSNGAPPARFSSCFPFLEQTHFIAPPRTLWPPPASPKVRWRNAQFVPLPVVAALVAEKNLDENRWYLDGPSECLLPADTGLRAGPFRPALRSHAGVDRLYASAVEPHRTACLEFAPDAGFWAAVAFADEAAEQQWSGPLRAAFRFLADTGVGGERALGWGRSQEPEFIDGLLPDMILPPSPHPAPPPAPAAEGEAEAAPKPAAPETAWWLVSLFSPAGGDIIDWHRGAYSLVTRGGRVESPAGNGARKKLLNMVEEGSVLVSDASPRGAAPNVAPEGFPHPVYRSGFALAIPIPLRFPERPMGAL